MSVEAVSLVFKCFPYGGDMKLLALSMADAATPTGQNIFKSVATMVTDVGRSESTIHRLIPKLLADGWLLREGESVGGKGRSNVYRINPAWMAAAHYELGLAAADGRQPNRVVTPKGVSLTPFDQTQRVSNEGSKGVKFEPKGVKNEPKGVNMADTRTLNIEHRTNNPLPPEGGDRENFDKTGEIPQNSKTEHAALLAKLIATHPNHETADTANASRALAQYAANALAPSAKNGSALDPVLAWRQMAQELAESLQSDAQSPRWQGDAHRYAPRLSKWLRGKAAMLRLPKHVRPVSAIKSEAQRTAEMLAEQALQSAKAAPPSPEIAAKLARLRGESKAVSA